MFLSTSKEVICLDIFRINFAKKCSVHLKCYIVCGAQVPFFAQGLRLRHNTSTFPVFMSKIDTAKNRGSAHPTFTENQVDLDMGLMRQNRALEQLTEIPSFRSVNSAEFNEVCASDLFYSMYMYSSKYPYNRFFLLNVICVVIICDYFSLLIWHIFLLFSFYFVMSKPEPGPAWQVKGKRSQCQKKVSKHNILRLLDIVLILCCNPTTAWGT